MKALILSLTFVLFSIAANCQEGSLGVELSVNDIEKGMFNIDSLRISLIEQGFQLTFKKQATKDRTAVEDWDFLNYQFGMNMKLVSVVLYDENHIKVEIIKTFSYVADKFLEDVRTKYPEKRTSPSYTITTNLTTKDTTRKDYYVIVYSNKESDIEVSLKEEPGKYYYCFDRIFK